MVNDLLTEARPRPKAELADESDARVIQTIVGELFRGEFLSAEQRENIVDYTVRRCRMIASGESGNDTFQTLRDTEDRVQELADSSTEDRRQVTPARAEANRLFAMGVFAYLETIDIEDDKAGSIFNNIGNSLFFVSPNITNYVGGINSQIELLAFAQRSPLGRRMADRAEGEIIYHGAFSENTGQIFIDGICAQPNVSAQIAYLNTINRLARQSVYSGEWANPFYHAVLQANRFVDESDTTHYLLKVASDQFAYETDMEYAQERVFYDDYSASDEELAPYIREADERREREEAVLREKFPHIPNWQRPVLVAANACAGFDRGIVDSIYMADGGIVPIAGAMSQGEISKDQAAMLGALYDGAVYPEISDQLGVALEGLSFKEQLRLLEYMSATNNERYHRLCHAIKGSEQPISVARAFLATEFGDDLSESILQIAEKGRGDEKILEIFSRIASIRENVAYWGEKAWFATDERYKAYFIGIRQSIEMRISQILSPVPDLIDGLPQEAVYYHRDGTFAEATQINSFDEVVQGLRLLDLLTRKIALSETVDKQGRVPDFGVGYTAVKTPVDESSRVRILFRPHENAASEARVKWVVTVTPEEQIDIFGRYLDINKLGDPRDVKLSLRLDLEKISKQLSLDLGSRMMYGDGDSGYPERLLATLITAGVQHTMRRRGQETTHNDYHVRGAFPDESSDPSRFAVFVEAMQGRYVRTITNRGIGSLGMNAAVRVGGDRLAGDEVTYTGLFVDDESIQRLRQLLPPRYQNTPANPHITINFRPENGAESVLPGEMQEVKVVGIVDDGRAQVAIVEVEGRAGIANPHITISTANNRKGRPISPAYGRTLANRSVTSGNVVYFEKPIVLTTVSGYYDGGAGLVVKGDILPAVA